MENRWLSGAIPAVMIHISIGSVYAFSVLTKHFMDCMAVDDKSIVTWAFSISIFVLGMSAAFLGKYVERIGPRKSALICCLFFGAGLIGSGVAVILQSLWLLFLFYGVVAGIGLGVGYITPIKTLIRWFYDKRGFAMGLAVLGFGLAAMIAGPLMEALISSLGLANMFFVLGTCYMLIIFTASRLISPPPDNYEICTNQIVLGDDCCPVEEFTADQAVKKLSFYALWFMLFVNVASGVSLLAVASPMLQTKFPLVMTAAAAATVVGIVSLCNGVGRFAWASLSDFVGRPIVYSGFLILQAGLFLGLTFTQNPIVFQILLFIIASCYGAGFACIPAYLSDMYGVKNVSSIHGRILTAWAFAGVIGPFFTTRIVSTSGGYTSILIYISIALVVAFAVSFIAAREYKKRHGSYLRCKATN